MTYISNSDNGGDNTNFATSNGSSLMIVYTVYNNANNYPCSGELTLTNIGASQTIYPAFYGRSSAYHSNLFASSFTGGYVATAGCNAFQLFFSSGNISTGTFKLYGVL
jgi:hypothetical protein